MRRILFAAAAAILAVAGATPAFAGTLEEVVAHGIVLTVQGMDVDVAYTPDGKFTALGGQVTGTWRIDGEKFCTTSNFQPEETCTVYPAGKKSGDSFDLTTPQGSVTIRIK